MSYMFEDGYFDVDCLPAPAEPEFLPGDEEEWYFDEEIPEYLWDDPFESGDAW